MGEIIDSFKYGISAIYCSNSEEQDFILNKAKEEGLLWNRGQKADKYKPYKIGLNKIYIYIRKGKIFASINKPIKLKTINLKEY